MIKNQWYVILESKEVKTNKPIGVTRFGEKLILWRDSFNKVNCIADKCIHRGVSLCKGKILNNHIQCPFHGFEYDGNGNYVLIPANGKNSVVPPNFKSKSYNIKESNGFIFAFFGDSKYSTENLPFFDDINENFSYKTITDTWPVHYSRVIENQLDVVHVPFIHKTTIGKGNKLLVNGPCSTIEGNKLTIKAFNSLDIGKEPLSSSELDGSKKEQKLIFHFPNLWQNYITKDIRAVIAFVPIDEENCKLYLRFYQCSTKVPVIKDIFNLFGSLANFIIENQDKRIVKTQQPKKSNLFIGENLIAGDLPIIQYRKRRAELQKLAP